MTHPVATTAGSPALAAAGQIGPLQTANRIVMSPLTSNFADGSGDVTDQLVSFYTARASGGVGLVIVEGAIVHPDGRGTPFQLMADRDDRGQGLRRIADGVHAHGVPVLLQLLHHGRQTTSALTGQSPISASAIRDPLYGETPREMTTADIARVIDDFAAAARRAVDAGFDGVELHAAHGYLFGGFLSARSNRRTDGYGGDLEGRARLLLEVVHRVRVILGETRALSVRLSAEEGVQDGITLAESLQVARWLEAAGADALDVSAGTRETHYRLSPTAGTDEGVNLALAARIRQVVDLPIITVGNLRSPAVVDAAITEGQTDFAAIGRAVIADDAWAAKAVGERSGPIIPCIGCNVCAGRRKRPEIRCPVNPIVGHESEWQRTPAAAPRTIVIDGSGLPGLIAAREASLRGHEVQILERGARIGGLSRLRARTPLQNVLELAIEALTTQLRQLDVSIEAQVAPTDVRWSSADVTAIARVDPSQGHVGPAHATRLDEILSAGEPAPGSWHVRGDSLIAAEVAAYLAACGRAVTLTARGRRVATDTNATLRHYVEDVLAHHGVVCKVEVADEQAAAIDADNLAGDWTPVVHAGPAGGDDEVVLGDDFNPSVLVGLTEEALQWALDV